jgi:hypothetical protein
MMSQERMLITCEEIFHDGSTVPVRVGLVVEQISNAFGVFACLGHSDGRSFQLEDEMGSKYLTLI